MEHKDASVIFRKLDRFYLALFRVLHFVPLRFDVEPYNRIFPQTSRTFFLEAKNIFIQWTLEEPLKNLFFCGLSVALIEKAAGRRMAVRRLQTWAPGSGKMFFLIFLWLKMLQELYGT